MRLWAIIAASLIGYAGAVVHKTAAEAKKDGDWPLLVSEVTWPGETVVYRGFTWLNNTRVPCMILSDRGKSVYVIFCKGEDKQVGDLRSLPFDKIIPMAPP